MARDVPATKTPRIAACDAGLVERQSSASFCGDEAVAWLYARALISSTRTFLHLMIAAASSMERVREEKRTARNLMHASEADKPNAVFAEYNPSVMAASTADKGEYKQILPAETKHPRER